MKNAKRAMIIFFCLLVVSQVPDFGQTSTARVRIIVDGARIYAQADPTSANIAVLPFDSVVVAEWRTGDWYLVVLPADEKGIVTKGYVHVNEIEVLTDAGAAQAAPRPQIPAPQASAAPPSVSGFKVMGGLSLADVTNKAERYAPGKKSYRQGFQGGMGFEIGLVHPVSLEIDVVYFQKGGKYEETRPTTIIIGGVTYSYHDALTMKGDEISVPALLKLRFLKGTSPYVAAGAEVGYVLSNKMDWTGTSLENGKAYDEDHAVEDMKEFTQSLDYGIVLGAGFELNLGGTFLTIDGRYHMGLANLINQKAIEDKYGVRLTEDLWVKSRAFVVMAGIKF